MKRQLYRASSHTPLLGLLALAYAACGGAGQAAGSGGAANGGGTRSDNTAGQTAEHGGSMNMGGTMNTGGSDKGGSSTGPEGGAGKGGKGGKGDGGSGGTPPVVVKTDCSMLPAPGTWENVSPDAFLNPSNMETMAVVVNPVDHTVFAAAGNVTNGGKEGTGVYRSDDCGATWKHISTGAGFDKLKTGDPWAMMIDPSNPQVMYINNGYGDTPTIFKSTNGGVDFTPLAPDEKNVLSQHTNFVQAIAMEKDDPKHIAVSFHDNCGAPFTGSCISHSTDSGATWHELPGPTQVSAWAEAASLAVLGPESFLYACDKGVFFTQDSGKNWDKVFDGSTLGSYAGSAHFGPDGTLYLGVTNQGVFASSPDDGPVGKKWTKLSGSPGNVSTIIDDGKQLIVTWSWDDSGEPFVAASLDDLTKWTKQKSAAPIKRGANQLAYDPEHHVVYGANWATGLWRLVTE